LGEVVASGGFRRNLLNGSPRTMWNRDAPESDSCGDWQFGYARDTRCNLPKMAGASFLTVYLVITSRLNIPNFLFSYSTQEMPWLPNATAMTIPY